MTLSFEDWKSEGNDLFKKGLYERAIMCYTQAISIDPQQEVLYSNRAAAYLKLRNYNAALQDGLKCVSLQPDSVKGYYRVGMAHIGMGNNTEGIEWLKKALKLDPNNAEIQAKVNQLSPQNATNSNSNNAPKKQSKPKQPSCAKCNTSKGNLSQCGRCMKTWYCSKECQKSHWPSHQSELSDCEFQINGFEQF